MAGRKVKLEYRGSKEWFCPVCQMYLAGQLAKQEHERWHVYLRELQLRKLNISQ